MEEFANQNF